MKKAGKIGACGVFFLFIGTLIFLGLQYIQAQGKSNKVKPTPCNNNGICESEEYNSNYSPEDQPCIDCKPKIYPALEILDMDQIVCEGQGVLMNNQVLQFKCTGGGFLAGDYVGEYHDTWASNKLPYFPGKFLVSIGDLDNDGVKEIVYAAAESRNEGKGSKATTYYNPYLCIFENGSMGAPSWITTYLGEATTWIFDMEIADIDHNGTLSKPDNELILVRGSRLEIYDLNGGSFQLVKIWYPTVVNMDNIWSIDIGDADNDGENEIVVAMFGSGAPVILEYIAESGMWRETLAETIDVVNPNLGVLYIDYTKIRDADNVQNAEGQKDNEIVCGGNNNRLMIWKYNKETGIYESVFISEDLGGFTEGVDVGDFNGDSVNEIVAGARDIGLLYLFSFNLASNTYEQVHVTDSGTIHLSDIVTGDPDFDGADEICVGQHRGLGFKIFDFIGEAISNGRLHETYSSPYGHYLEIK